MLSYDPVVATNELVRQNAQARIDAVQALVHGMSADSPIAAVLTDYYIQEQKKWVEAEPDLEDAEWPPLLGWTMAPWRADPGAQPVYNRDVKGSAEVYGRLIRPGQCVPLRGCGMLATTHGSGMLTLGRVNAVASAVDVIGCQYYRPWISPQPSPGFWLIASQPLTVRGSAPTQHAIGN